MDKTNLVPIRWLAGSSVEVFANDGEAVLTTLIFPEAPDRPIELWSSSETLAIQSLSVWKLNSAVPIQPAE